MSDAKVRWSSRKFWTMIFWQAVFTLLLCIGKIPESTFEAVTYLLLGGYLVSNVAQKALEARVSR